MTGFLDDLQPIGDPLQFWRSDNVWAVPAGSSGAGGKSAVVVHITSTDYIEPNFLAWEVFGSQTNWPLVDVVANAEWNKIAFDNAPIHASVEAGDTWYYWARALFDNGETVGDLGAFGSILIVGNVDNATALSVWGRASNTSGPRADIIAASDFQVLRRSGTAVGFGSVNLASANAVTGLLALANGGLDASLAASNGGIFYSTATAGAILAGVAALRRVLLSGNAAAPSWSAYTFPATAGASGNVLTSDGTNFVSSAPAASGDETVVGIVVVIDGNGSALTTGVKFDLEIPFGCTINSVTMLADQSGSVVVDIWKDSYANYPPVVGDTITAAAKPTISAATKSQDATLTGWNTAVTAGDILRFNVDSATTITRVAVCLMVTKTGGVASIGAVFDGGGVAIAAGKQIDIEVPFACTIDAVTMLGDQSGSAVVDIWKDTYANYPPVDAGSITAAAVPTISAATKSQDAVLTGWTKPIAAGSTLRFNVDSCSTITRLTVALKVTRT